MIAALSFALLLAAVARPGAQASPSPPHITASPLRPDGVIQADEGPLEALLETSEGPFVIRLLPDLAPNHVAHFVKTARKGGYDGTTFHRVVTRGIIEGGDPLSKDPAKEALYGTGGLGLLKAEFSDRPMTRGAVAAVLRPSSPDSAGNPFFIVLSDQPSLTGKYTIFAEVQSGFIVLDKIGMTAVVGDKPEKRIVIQKVTIRKTSTEPARSPRSGPSLSREGSGLSRLERREKHIDSRRARALQGTIQELATLPRFLSRPRLGGRATSGDRA